jgi:hypothetical protein
VKDAKGDLSATSWVLSRTDLAYYSGDDPTLPLLASAGWAWSAHRPLRPARPRT